MSKRLPDPKRPKDYPVAFKAPTPTINDHKTPCIKAVKYPCKYSPRRNCTRGQNCGICNFHYYMKKQKGNFDFGGNVHPYVSKRYPYPEKQWRGNK